MFYDDSILPGTKTKKHNVCMAIRFYDDSILPGTKTHVERQGQQNSFMMTQFFQVLKP